jgi:DNA-binding CsgD family transcriptional regulator
MDLEQERASHGGREKRVMAAVMLLFSAVAILAMSDLVADFREGTTLGHVLIEGAVVLVGIVGLALGLRRMRALRRAERDARSSAEELSQRLAQTRAEADRWRSEAKDLLQGLGAAIERQLVRWELTKAESEIGLLLLKGLSHKDIADLRGSSEATVRQQARAIYRKAGVEGRHDLAAFFLEGLIAPPEAG